ncbi:YqjF family protein [Winogradskyella psychrotolerans]|uniref:YqjF family protein n=1 Tax=Winogradskyella psychrotolerans TaxID=1344585 RepID=UPI001C070273|nr:DUF2071 domain-containing protein [Winogradskyella psychrotolerans]MBU2928216.1 DUF2071 domain-containing protein [Winogradskyella psychrotolerans]
MNIQDLLKTTAHRPWKLPQDDWKFYQEWNNAIFLHFEVDLEELKKWVPEALEIDLFDGKPWVSVVAFTMEKIRPKNLPSFSPISNFDEINIRTYMKSGSKTGVYFLSIEGGRKLSCKIAKSISELPYRFSKIKRTEHQYHSLNTKFNDHLNIEFSIGETMDTPSELDLWLTERYVLFQDTTQSINEFEIHHLKWPFRHMHITKFDFNYPRFKHLIHHNPNKIQYSEGVKVIAWGKTKTKKTS